MKIYKNVDEYIKSADKDKQDHLKQIRSIIKEAKPDAVEDISYGMPAYTLEMPNGKIFPLFYFAAMKGHLGLYPTPGPIETCKDILTEYSTSKGCIRIPYSNPVPEKLIIKLLKERVKEIKQIQNS
jgi:uncharacterized protein YdhG (YjbR/CyaY superfamily)